MKRFYSSLILSGFLSAAQVTHAAPSVRLEQVSPGTWVVRILDTKEPVNVSVDSNDASLPPILGTQSNDGADRLFKPRFPLQPGLAYRVTLSTSPPTVLKFAVPAATSATATRIGAVYPSASLLPENQLKFYIEFSASMGRGDAYRWVRLLDEHGQKINVPFLELGEELWDPENKRLTLYFDPGRVKSGLLPGREMGAPLRNGHSYTLVLDAGWPDAKGKPLAAEYRKLFRVGVADHEPPDPKRWKVLPPLAASSDPLIVEFPESLDHALLSRMLEIADANGSRVVGAIKVEREETRWIFTPSVAWKSGTYLLRANTALEDLAGNKLNRPFEFEGSRTPAKRASVETIVLPFSVGTSTQ
ncbi:MAG TPA: hypothetical protein VK629_01755 [Steroidobacteraceae bacterium]|nr:hypothetical protein [Steroidobacteraceae bacterium]